MITGKRAVGFRDLCPLGHYGDGSPGAFLITLHVPVETPQIDLETTFARVETP
jgi:hypothetical protein